MTWNSVWPDGTVSVKANELPGTQNTLYVETNTQKDHYFDEDANNDGHHKKIEMPDIADIDNDPFALDANGDPTVLSASQECMIYTRQKTAVEAVTTQQDEAFAYTIEDPTGTPVNHITQLGFRCMINWQEPASGSHPAAPNAPLQADVTYAHNVKIQDIGTPASSGLYRNAAGDYTITFDTPMPSANYVVFGGAVRDDSGYKPIHMQVKPSVSIATANKSKTSVRVVFLGQNEGRHDPVTGWLAICGG